MKTFNLNFTTRKGNDCLLGNIQNILNYHGIWITESQIFILGDGLKLSYKNDSGNPIHLVETPYKCLMRFASFFDAQINSFESEDSCESLLYKIIDHEKPMIFAVKPAFINSPQYINLKSPVHFITPIGLIYDNTNNITKVQISDPFFPNFADEVFQETINCIELKKAWGEAENILIDLPETLIKNLQHTIDFESLCFERLSLNLYEYLYTSASDNGINVLNALYEQYDEFYHYFKNLNITQLESVKLELWNVLNALIMLKDFLSKHTKKFANCIKQLDECCRLWELFINKILLKYIRDKNRIKSKHIVPQDTLYYIIVCEKKLFTDLLNEIKEVKSLEKGN